MTKRQMEPEDDGKIPWIDEQAIANKYERIYHYTNFINLRSILDSKGLFASPYSETNDRDEFRAAAHLLCPQIYDYTREKLRENHPQFIAHVERCGGDPDQILLEDSHRFYEIGLKTNAFKPHLTCFSYHADENHQSNGILTMWRSYGGDDGGIALGFDMRKLIEHSSDLQTRFKFPAIYFDFATYGTKDPQLAQRLAQCEDLKALLYTFLEAGITKHERKLDGAALRKLLVLSACVKHSDFADEREIRLIVAQPDESAESESVRRHGSRMIIEFSDCLSEILIGPSRDQKAIAAAINYTLSEFHRTDVAVRLSRTPFRNL